MLKFFKKHIWILVIIMAILTVPQSLSTQAQLKMRVLVTGVAIDKISDEYAVTAQVVMPSMSNDGGGSARVNLVTAQGMTMAECFNQVAFSLGKTIGLSHLSYVMIGESLRGENLSVVLDFFLRNRYIDNSVGIFLAEGSGKEEITKTKYFELGTAIGLQKQFLYKQTASNGIMVQLLDFLNGMYNPSKSGMISYIKIYDESIMGQDEKENVTDGGLSSNDLLGRFVYRNKIGYFKDGVQVGAFEDEQAIIGVIMLNSQCQEMCFNARNVNDELYNNADVNVFIGSKKVQIRAKFQNGQPVVDINIEFGVANVREIKSSSKSRADYNVYSNFLTDTLKESIRVQTIDAINAAINQAKADNVDVFEFINMLHRSDVQTYRQYKKENGLDAILQNSIINIDVSIKKIN